MEETLAKSIMSIAPFAIFVPLAFSIRRIRQGSDVQRWLSIVIIVYAIAEFLFFFTGKHLHQNNLYLTHIVPVVEFALLIWFFRVILSEKIIKTLIVLFTILSIFNVLFLESLTEFNTIARAVEALILIIVSLMYFYRLLRDLNEQYLERSPLFWIATSILIYFSGSFFIFIYGNYIMPSAKLSLTFWAIHALFSILKYILFTIALWIKPKS